MRHKPFYALCIILLSAFLFFTPSDVLGETETAVSDENWSFVLYNHNAGMPFSEANSLQQTQDGFIYIGCYGGLLRFDGEEFYRYDDPRLNNIIVLFVDSRDRLWIATTSDGFGVMEDGNLTFYGVKEGLNEQYVCCFAEDDDGNILVGTVGGLYYVNGDNKLNRLSDPLLDENFISRLCRDGQVETIPEAEKLASDVILRIRKNEAQNSWWIVTSRSLFILHKGKIREVSDLPTLHNYDVEFDSRGNAWLLAADGIYVSAARNLLSGKKARYIHYDYRSGLPFIVTPHCRNYISDDGVLYMSGNDGVVRISINSVSEHKANVQLTVPYIEVDGETRQLTPGEKVTLQPWTKRIWVHPFALSYSLNEPIVAYSLDGFDDSLHISNRSELPSIIYTNLKGGFYTFRFAILNPTTGEIEKEITVPIEKRKALHERILFRVLLAAAAAGLVMLFLKLYLRKKAREMEAEKEQDRIRTELSVARDIQSSMLPRTFPPFPEKKEIDLYASMQPAKEVAGDFYDFFLIDDDHLALAIADVSGKGMGPALFMMVAKNTLKSSAMSGRLSSPGEILADVNNKLCKDNEALLFVTVWLGILTISTGKLVSANGGHEYPVIYRKDEGYSLIKDKHGLALGIMEDVVYKETEWTLGRGDGIFVYTDGVPEATDARNQLFGTERMLSALEHHSGQCPEDVLNGVHRAVDEFVGEAPQFDDLTMLAITYKG